MYASDNSVGDTSVWFIGNIEDNIKNLLRYENYKMYNNLK